MKISIDTDLKTIELQDQEVLLGHFFAQVEALIGSDAWTEYKLVQSEPDFLILEDSAEYKICNCDGA